MIAELMSGLLRANLAAAAAILLVLALRRPVRSGFGARAAYGLWVAPLLAALAVVLPHPARHAPLPPVMAQAAAVADVFDATPMAAVASARTGPDLAETAFAAWLIGAAGVAGLLVIHQARFVSSFGKLSRQGRRLRRAEREGVGPALVGVLRPWIVTPADFEARFAPAERELILAHEDVHLARGDAAANALACTAQALCWFNPLVHLAARLARIDQELACDAAVIDRFPDRRRAYAELLLKTQIATQPLPLGCHWPAGAAHPLKERIAMLKLPSPARTARRLGVLTTGSAALACAAAAWAAQPGQPVQAPAAPAAAIPNNGRLEPTEAAKLVGPGQTMLCKPDENRELHNCKILESPFTRIATADDVQREWPAAARTRGLTGYVTLSCVADYPKARLDRCSAYHYGGVAERPEWQADFAAAAIRVISIIRLKPNPGSDVAPLARQGFYTIEFNDHPRLPGGPPGDPPVTRFPDFLPGPKKPAATPREEASAHRISVAYASDNGSASPLILQPDWAAKPSAADVARLYPKADQDRLGGTATLDCHFAADGRLSACHVVAETPPGDGFGAAALKLAGLFRANPTSRDGVAVAGGAVRIPIRFGSPDHPPGPTGATAVITRPVWLEKPGPADIARLYPPEAARQGLEARVMIRCLVGPDGRLAECGVARPADGATALPRNIEMDFGTATLQLAKRFRMAATTSDGAATAGAVINIPVVWQPPRQAEPSGPSARAAVVQPRWTRIPTAAELAHYYPPEAQKQNLEGMTTLSCGVDRQGQLFDCTASEPSGFGKTPAMREDFRKATLDLVPLFRMQPRTVGGRPTDGGRVVIPIRWSLPTDPAAAAALNALRDPGPARPQT